MVKEYLNFLFEIGSMNIRVDRVLELVDVDVVSRTILGRERVYQRTLKEFARLQKTFPSLRIEQHLDLDAMCLIAILLLIIG